MNQPLLTLAEAYVTNDSNRGVHGRNADLAEFAARRLGAPVDTASFVISEHFRRYVEGQLALIAPNWESELEYPLQRILDAGCGAGLTSLALSRRYPEATVLGVDVEAPAIALAKRLGQDEPMCSFLLTRLEDLAEPSAHYDLIHCRAVLEHVYDPEAVVHKLLRLLSPGGVLYVETPNYFYPWEPHVRVPMFPKGPKCLVKFLCHFSGRDPAFVDHLNFSCDPRTIRRWSSTADVNVAVIDLVERKARRILLDRTQAPVVARRAAVTRLLARSSTVSRLVLLLLRRVPLTPSVMLLFCRRA